ncbi:MAG: hypothetical protein AAF668_02760 [Pseudomonadota bacterium]
MAKSPKASEASATIGFTLVEAIVVSIITSLILFSFAQGLQGWLSVSAATERAISRSQKPLRQQIRLETIVQGLTPEWPDGPFPFNGTSNGFEGLTRTNIHQEHPGLVPVRLELSRIGNSNEMVYSSDGVRLILERIDDCPCAFAYLGADARWYPQWPPRQNPEGSPFSDANFYQTPQLPRAIKFSSTGNVSIGAVASHPYLRLREQELE